MTCTFFIYFNIQITYAIFNKIGGQGYTPGAVADTSIPENALSTFVDALDKANVRVARQFPGDSPRRQPVHVVYGGAHLFKADAAQKLGAHALKSLQDYAPDAATLAGAMGLDPALADRIYLRVVDKLTREPVEDFRIDFEDGFGNRPDEEEDRFARGAADEVAAGLAAGSLPPGIGIRIKPLSEELKRRSFRTFDLFLTRLLERTNGALPRLVTEGGGRIVAAHFGTYDYTAACGITAAHQHMLHPVCDFAKHVMQITLAGTGIWLSDGATNVMPIGSRDVVHRAWRLHAEHVLHSLVTGFYQGWDLHPAQLPSRYATVFSFFLEGLDAASERLRNFIAKAAQATLVGDVFDDAATGQGLLNYFLRAMNCGAITEHEAVEKSGLTLDELRSRSFVKILDSRRGGRS